MNIMNLLSQLKMSSNPNAMIQSMIGNNPQLQQAWAISQSIANGGSNKSEQLKQACEKSGMDYNKTKEMLSSLGINI